MLFPFYWVVITAFKTNEQMRTFSSVFWPSPWTTQHFNFMLTETDFLRIAHDVLCDVPIFPRSPGALRAARSEP